jgi:hypothetical protein
MLNRNPERVIVFAEPDTFLHELLTQVRPVVQLAGTVSSASQ